MSKKETATFAAGCFWGVEQTFSKIPGVIKTRVGYMGGDEKKYPNPSYKLVCTDKTGHAEVVYIEFDSAKVSYQDLLKVFWENHDPTTLNRQGPDVGTQYRSVIFYYNEKQKREAEESLKKEQKRLGKVKIVTVIVPAMHFFEAEEYHQKYLEKKGIESCHL